MTTVITSEGPACAKKFPGELSESFEDALAALKAPRPGPRRLKWTAVLLQPLLGALSHSQKGQIEAAVGERRFFTAAGATVLNVLNNIIIYPVVLVVVGALALERDVFTGHLKALIASGLVVATLEAIWRMREALLGAAPRAPTIYRGAAYAPLLAVLFRPLIRVVSTSGQVGTQQTDSFYGGDFEDKQERERRYGEVYTVQNQGGGLLVRLELPRRVPHSALKDELGIPDRMPDYDVHLELQDGYLIVKGRLEDPNLRKLAAISPAFPPDFSTHIKLPAPVRGFKHRFVDKTLEVVLVKE